MNPEDIALFDLDGTLCDYEGELIRKLEEIRSPRELPYLGSLGDSAPEYIKKRLNLIRAQNLFGRIFQNLSWVGIF